MKKFIKMLLAVLLLTFSVSINTQAQSFIRKGNSFEQVSQKSNASTNTKTKFTWKDTKGNIYPIYITKNGRCFVNKVSSKTGKPYKDYLDEKIAKSICKELGVEYKELKK